MRPRRGHHHLQQRPRRCLARVLGALLVLRLEAREVAPWSAGLILLAWLRRPVIEMPLATIARPGHRRQEEGTHRRALWHQLDQVYPF